MVTSVPMPTELSLVPAASSPIVFPAPAADADFTPPVHATGTSSGTTALAITAATGLIAIGSGVTGAGVPAGLTIVSQVSGPTGGNGTYTTSAATTLSAVALTITQQLPIDPDGDIPPIVVKPATVIPGEPLSKTQGTFPYTLVLPTFSGPPLIPTGTLFNQSHYPPFDATHFPWLATPPPIINFNRAPPFPAYPS